MLCALCAVCSLSCFEAVAAPLRGLVGCARLCPVWQAVRVGGVPVAAPSLMVPDPSPAAASESVKTA